MVLPINILYVNFVIIEATLLRHAIVFMVTPLIILVAKLMLCKKKMLWIPLGYLILVPPIMLHETWLIDKGLPITHTGSALLTTTSSPLHLKDILYALGVSHNLISIAQLCQTNSVFIEFFSWHFQVKDLNTGVILLCGRNKDNVYKLPSAPIPLSQPCPSSCPFIHLEQSFGSSNTSHPPSCTQE